MRRAARGATSMLVGLFLAWVVAGPASAADDATLDRVMQRLSLAAAPWCGRATELGSDGQRRCRVRLTVLDTAGPVPATAAQLLDGVMLTRPLLAGLDESELAVVLGHELAHLALGHARLRLAQRMAESPSEFRALGLFDDWVKGVQDPPHPDTPRAPHEQEFDADALGLVLAMRAGYPASAGARLFESVHGLPGWEAGSGSTHPAPAERAAALREVARQACARLDAGRPLLPAQERLLPLAQHRRDEAGAAPGAWPPASVCDGPAPPMPRGAGASATPFATPFTLGRHGPGGACPHCDPR